MRQILKHKNAAGRLCVMRTTNVVHRESRRIFARRLRITRNSRVRFSSVIKVFFARHFVRVVTGECERAFCHIAETAPKIDFDRVGGKKLKKNSNNQQ